MDSGQNNLSKRAQINASSKAVFIWVAIASVVVSFAVVVSIFLYRQMVFNQKVIDEKAKTETNLKTDLKNAGTLKDEVNKLLGNAALNSSKAKPEDSNLQVVFDALPTTFDSASLGASLQQVILGGGVVASIENLSVASAGDASATTSVASGSKSSPEEIDFTVTVTGSADQIKNALVRLESSIRPIVVTNVTIQGGTTLNAAISAKTYYQPLVELKLRDKTVQP